jgi:signal transduction histidine kinase
VPDAAPPPAPEDGPPARDAPAGAAGRAVAQPPATAPAAPAAAPGGIPTHVPSALVRRVALVVIAWAISEPLLLDGEASRWASLGLGLAVSLPLLLVRRAPLAVALVVVAVYLAQTALGARMADAMSPELALAFALFGVAAYAPASGLRALVAVPLAAAVPAGLWLLSRWDVGEVEQVSAFLYLYDGAVAVAGVLPGLALRGRRGEVAALEAEVEALCVDAATEIGVAVEEERRTLSQGLVRVVNELIDDVGALVVEARRTLAEAGAPAGALGHRMADAAGRAGDELRALLGVLTAQPATGVPRPRLERVDLRALTGLALPAVGLAALGVADRLQVPDLPLTVTTVGGETLRIPAPAVPPVVGYAVTILGPAGLLLRRRAPVVAVVWVAAAIVLRAVLDDVESLNLAQVFTCGVLAYNAGAWPWSTRAAVGAGVVVLATTAVCWLLEQYHFAPLVYVYMVAVLVGAWAVGRAIRGDLREALALRGRARMLRGQRDRLRRAAIRGERRDVAREMHDVVGHGLSLIVVQSGVVDVLARRDPARALDALALVEGATRATQAELQALRAALGDPTDPREGPRACSRALERIVDDARAAGQPVMSWVDPRVDELGPDARTAVVRIVQESLTNARKHAAGGAASVEVTVRGDRVELRIVNDAGVPLPGAPRGASIGLRGMTERAEARGGRLTAGPDDEGRWAVEAELPWSPRVPAVAGGGS